MTVALPDRSPLEMPPGHHEELERLVRQVAGAARCLAEVDDRLAAAAAAAPGWLGEDAAATAAQVGTVAALVRAAAETMLPVAGRLSAHAELLLMTRRRVEALRAEQDEDFRRASMRWCSLPQLQLHIMIESPTVRVIVSDVEAGEASRRRRHQALLEELAEDAAATARLLVDACDVVGSRGRPGDADDVVAYLAGRLPGWGDPELARRGRAFADRLTGEATTDERVRFASDAVPYAGHTVFANALLARLGTEGVTELLTFLDFNALGPDSPLARLLATSLGAAVSAGPADPVARIAQAQYVPAEGADGLSDNVAAGLAIVLAAGVGLASGGVPTRVVAEWSRQLLLREREQRVPVGRRSGRGAPEASDPAALGLSILAGRADPGESARFLSDGRIWEALLRRVWGDGGVAVASVVSQAGREVGTSGDQAVRTGLATVGGGLSADDPDAWTVNRPTLAAVAPALGDAVGAHIDVAVAALHVGVDGRTADDRGDLLKGLGTVTLDRGAAAVIERALTGWAQASPRAPGDVAAGPPFPAVAVLGSYVAVREYAQRADHALDAMEDREAAENKQWLWEHSIHHLPDLLPGYGGTIAGLGEGYAAILLDMDGTWDDRPDQGVVLDRSDAAVAALAALTPLEGDDIRAVADQAMVAFDRAAAALGERRVPMSPDTDWFGPAKDAGLDFQGDRAERGSPWRLPRRLAPR